MGIDFKALIKNFGVSVSKMQNDKNKIDTKAEYNNYVSGWDAIKAQAEKNNEQVYDVSDKVDIDEVEAEMKSELAGLMGADFGRTTEAKNKANAEKPVFSDEEISLENMMALLSPDDDIDIDKLREQNKKPMLSAMGEKSEISNMREFGFDNDLTEIILEQAPDAIKYISDAISSGRADAIRDNMVEFERDITGAKNILGAIKNFTEQV